MIIGQLHHLGHSQATVLIPADVLAYGIPRDAKNIGNASHSYSHCIATENIFYFCHKFVVLVSPSARTETKTTKKIPCQNNSGRGQFYSDFCGSLFCDEKGQQTTAVEGLARAPFPDNGRVAEDPIRMFKYLLLKTIYTLSDVDVVEHSRYDLSYKYFLGMMPEDDVINPSSLCKFRRMRLKDMSPGIIPQRAAVIPRVMR